MKEIDNTDSMSEFAKIFSNNEKVESESSIESETRNVESAQEEKPVIEEKKQVEVKQEDQQSKNDTSDDLKSFEKRLNESKSWAHKQNIAYVNAKKKIGEFLGKLQEDEILAKEDVERALSYFSLKDNETESPNDNVKENSFASIKTKLDQEFAIFKKYAKIDNAEEKYNSFFYFWPLLDAKEQEELTNYLQEESGDVVIDKIMLTGTELYDTVYKGAEKHGSIISYIKSLSEVNTKLNDKIKELEAKLENTTEKVYSRSINSKVQETQNIEDKKSLADIWRRG